MNIVVFFRPSKFLPLVSLSMIAYMTCKDQGSSAYKEKIHKEVMMAHITTY